VSLKEISQTTIDARRIGNTGVPVLQINTGSGCHLDAEMVNQGRKRIKSAGSFPVAD